MHVSPGGKGLIALLNFATAQATKNDRRLVKNFTKPAVFLPYTSRKFFRLRRLPAPVTALSGDMKEVIMTGARN